MRSFIKQNVQGLTLHLKHSSIDKESIDNYFLGDKYDETIIV